MGFVNFTPAETALLLLVGFIAGLLPSTIMDRRGIRLAADIGAGVTAVFAAAWLLAAARDLLPLSLDMLAGKPPEKKFVDVKPGFEPVVLPLAPLAPLLKPVVHRSRDEICDTLVRAAENNDLPVPFFIRLLYRESSFRPAAISTAGAQGVAQFMPETAADRRLDNPFDPVEAIPVSARLLHDHYRRYGNLGLAAAAYNAGPRRVDDWRAKKGPMPQETQDYVKAITGRPVEAWTDPQTGGPAVKVQKGAPCQEAAGLLAWDGPDAIPLPLPGPRAQAIAQAKIAELAAREAAKKRAKEAKESKDKKDVKEQAAKDTNEKSSAAKAGEAKELKDTKDTKARDPKAGTKNARDKKNQQAKADLERK
jgi:soluble lytic murein transglycosylase-like protein